MENYTIEKVAFEGPKTPYLEHTVRASYLTEPHAQDALIEILKDGQVVKHFFFPSYKIWNVAAHFEDIIDELLNDSTAGIAAAASTGLDNGTIIIAP